MTLLSILFVLGVTFLATMSFEADMIAAEKRRGGNEQGAGTLSDGFRGAMRGGFLDAGGSPFGDSGKDGPGATFAELPGLHNVFGPIEPINLAGADNLSGTQDDFNPAYAAFTDASYGTGVPVPHGVLLSSTLHNGEDVAFFRPNGLQSNVNLIVCRGGIRKGFFCDPDAPDDCPGSTCSGPVAVDADGDGIVDSFLSQASEAGLSADQIARLSVQVNGTGSEKTEVYVGLRGIAHGGMANLNASHPTIIEAALGLDLFAPPYKLINADGSYSVGYLLHSPSGNPTDAAYAQNRSPRSFYSPSTEESLLRRRGIIPPRTFPPSRLQGDPFLTDQESLIPPIPFGGDMANFLFWPKGDGLFESVAEGDHRFTRFAPEESITGGTMRWGVRMEPFMATAANLPDEYDRRHLVTTVSHDDLLARGGMLATDGAADGGQDLIEKMSEVNRIAAESDQHCPDLFPFEFLRYPHDLRDAGECCNANGEPQFDQCDRNARKGRLQVSLPWIGERLAEVNDLVNDGDANSVAQARVLRQRIQRIVYEAFYLMVRNAVGESLALREACGRTDGYQCDNNGICLVPPGKLEGFCSDGAAYFDDVICPIAGPNTNECNPDEYCSPINYTPNQGVPTYYCADKWTGLRRSEARLTRTAASLTANFFDFEDGNSVPTAIPIRMMDFDPAHGICAEGDEPGRVCTGNNQCGISGICLIADTVTGSNFDFDKNPRSSKGLYVYGLEQQPYITEIGSITAAVVTPSPVISRAIELFNPYAQAINLTADRYFVYEVPPGGTLNGVIPIPLTGTIETTTGTTPKPFTVFYSGTNDPVLVPLAPPNGTVTQLTGQLQFAPGWTIYLVREVEQDDENDSTGTGTILARVVVDQITIPPGSNVGQDSPPGQDCSEPDPPGGGTGRCSYTLERVVKNPAGGAMSWTMTVPEPFVPPEPKSRGTLANWNVRAPTTSSHPVEVNFANTGNMASSFPTTGSMLLLMRHANRAINDLSDAPTYAGIQLQPIPDLAFTTQLAGDEANYRVQFSDALSHFVQIKAQEQIDNGRMPIFDLGEDSAAALSAIGRQVAHHVPAQQTPAWAPFDPNSRQIPGTAANVPWGQLVFDYFTAIPLDSAGPYPPCAGTTGQNYACSPAGSPYAKPRVDLDGLRVHGRINLNAAPPTVLAGLPFIPMTSIPLPFQQTISGALGLLPNSTDAIPIGPIRAQAIAAYRDARAMNYFDAGSGPNIRTGDYGALTDPDGTLSGGFQSFGWRGWTDLAPAVRRGTGFVTVGELANVRHEVVPPNSTIASPATRLDQTHVDFNTGNNNTQNFIAAAATLVALNDWATVRSHVFTIYGHIRGAENENITDPKPAKQRELRRQDVDARAIRFQETIDRLPTFLGNSLPVRIGNRTVAGYLDEGND